MTQTFSYNLLIIISEQTKMGKVYSYLMGEFFNFLYTLLALIPAYYRFISIIENQSHAQ
jgi:hypothetical protein